MVAFADAKLVGGFDLIAKTLNIEKSIKESDIIITAEGAIDFQTVFGKTPAGVANLANKYKKPIFVFAGAAQDDASKIEIVSSNAREYLGGFSANKRATQGAISVFT